MNYMAARAHGSAHLSSPAGMCAFLLLLLAFVASCVDGAFTGTRHEGRNRKALPQGACYWRQGSLINRVSTGPTSSGCRFEVRDEEFLNVIGSSPKLQLLVQTDAHEGGAYYPDSDDFYFTTNRRVDSQNGLQVTDLKKVNIKTAKISTLSGNDTDVPNGLCLDNEGNLIVTEQGSKSVGGFIKRINPKTLAPSIVADNWFDIPFNSPNDVVVKRDGSIWITDPSYGSLQGFRTAPKVNNQVYRVSTSGVVDAVADGFVQPNGLAFSADEKRLYVTDTGFATGLTSPQYDPTKPHSIYVFDVLSDGYLSNRRLFASVGVYDGSSPGLGIPDGIKVDTKERVYTGTVDGVQVFGPSGRPLGLIRQPGISNTGFGGKKLDTLYILNGTTISFIKLQAQGAGLTYATKFS